MQRRTFLRQAGLLSALSLLEPGKLLASPSSLKVGLQLYTLRDYIGKDVKGVLTKVAKAGYQEVETYGYSKAGGFWGLTAKEFKAVLAANGLTTSSGHYEMNGFVRDGNQDALKTYIEAAKICGQTYVVVPHLDDKLRATADDFKVVAERVNKAGELCKAAGLRVAYHNHDFEFKPVGGTTLYDVLLKETDPALVDFELDLYWVVRAGQDPIKLMEAHPKRFTMWHVKDMDKAQPEHNTEVGAGSIDFKKIFQHATASGLRHIFMEQEYFAIDAYQSITQSASYIKKNLLS
ncbi:sugar phosphate isomerase/epimerase family protein [Hymenobacter sp. BT491]|uniref:sugar phosphate isomerase/epimerase family protein n=1 Tax=Hymenobacter sp. BT491 TaxID=2766779 RepID=UPI001653B5BA|nr:sugar phosphate isomerase/epimerase [Hymenobacter sp. BT491]MBC6989557.1 sugar phosphate isomerase/epimerase [Hymenobacter sp. BT491]